jgi:hypothetical protein
MISIPARSSSFKDYRSSDYSPCLSCEEEICSDTSSAASSWALSSGSKKSSSGSNTSLTLRQAISGITVTQEPIEGIRQKHRRFANPTVPEEGRRPVIRDWSRYGPKSEISVPPKPKKKTEIDTVCQCILLYDSNIVTFGNDLELHMKLPSVQLCEHPNTEYQDTIGQILLSEYNVVLKRAPEKISTYLFTHPLRSNLINYLYFGVVSHFSAKNTDIAKTPRYTSIEDTIRHVRFQSGTRALKCYTAAKVALLRSMYMFSSIQHSEERLPYSFDPFGCLDLSD